MSKSNKVNVPVLKDVVVPGKDIPQNDNLPSVLTDFQIKSLNRDIDRIIQTRLQAALKKAGDEVTEELKTYLDKKLPELVKQQITQKQED